MMGGSLSKFLFFFFHMLVDCSRTNEEESSSSILQLYILWCIYGTVYIFLQQNIGQRKSCL